jgi:Rps23 Pro-64 3,4-dihydroxylase Tpa1-like proline 4-hydroxylase
MDLKDKKEFLHKNGYCEFKIEEYNPEFSSILDEIKYKTDDVDYLKSFKSLRFDYIGNIEKPQIHYEYENHNECNKKKWELLEKYPEKGIAQIWLKADAFISFDKNYIDSLHNIFYEIVNYFYGKTIDDVNIGLQWTLYNESCFLKDHNDGGGQEYQNTCAVLIYLNEEWEQEWGGNLILRNTKNPLGIGRKTIHKVVPKFGTVAIIDLAVFDTAHAVEKIVGEHNRVAILGFATSKHKKD